MPAHSLLGSKQPGREVPGRVAVVDDNPELCQLIEGLLTSVGLQVETFASAREFMGRADVEAVNCLVLDVRLPGKNGLDFFDELRRAGMAVPVVFISGFGDIPMAVRAIKRGAVEFLPKPFAAQDLLDAVQRGVEQDREGRDLEASAVEFRRRMATLTSRERQVMEDVIHGRPNREIARALGISEVTVKAHRRQVMSKMGAATFADLVRMSVRLSVDDRSGLFAVLHSSPDRSIR